MSPVTGYRAETTRRALSGLARAGLRHDEFLVEVIELVGRAVPSDAMCIATTDPATGMFTDSRKVGLDDDGGPRFMYHEYAVQDVAKFADLAQRPYGIGVLREETHGDPASSARFTELLRPLFGAEHELRGVARSGGLMWGAFALYRGAGSPAFNEAEADFLAQLEPTIADGLRASILASAASDGIGGVGGPAVLVFDADGRLLSATASAEDLARDLDSSAGDDLWAFTPLAIDGLVQRLRVGDGAVPRARVRGRSGRWYSLHAAPFRGKEGATRQLVVTIEPARPPEILPLLMAAYGLTERETAVVQALLRGESTHAIAQALHLSPYTVQDHFKAIFEKIGVSSRREVASRVFYGHYLEGYQEQRIGVDGSPLRA